MSSFYANDFTFHKNQQPFYATSLLDPDQCVYMLCKALLDYLWQEGLDWIVLKKGEKASSFFFILFFHTPYQL